MTADGYEDDDRGVVFPRIDGDRSTTATGQAIFAAAARAADPALADGIERADSWYREYVRFAARLVEAEVVGDVAPDAVPTAGLESVHERFRFRRDGDVVPVREAVGRGTGDELSTVTVQGEASGGPGTLEVPYEGGSLSGDALHRQLDRWVDAGTVEPSFAEAIRRVMANPDWLDLSDRTFVVLGAGAEMGPLESLCRWRADLALVDLPQPRLWDRILTTVRDGRGRARVPLRNGTSAPQTGPLAEVAGADLVTDLPEIAAWLDRLEAGPLTLGNYVYADGALNVRVSVAVDALAEHLADRRDDLSAAVLATPTDVYAVPEGTREESLERFASTGLGRRLVRVMSGGRLFAPNYGEALRSPDGRAYGVADCLVPQQGPNYALAKRLHRWRARWVRHRGMVSSINVAPPTRTVSVTKNKMLAAAYEAAPAYDVEIFEPETSRVLMAAMLVHDLRYPGSAADPQADLGHHLDLLSEGAIHGGLWRIAFAPRTVLPLAVARGMARRTSSRA